MAPHDQDHLRLRRVDIEYLVRVLAGIARYHDASTELVALHEALARLLRPLETARIDGEARRMLRDFLGRHDERSTRRSGIDLRGCQGLAPRVRETFDWLLTGATEKEIASALGISVPHRASVREEDLQALRRHEPRAAARFTCDDTRCRSERVADREQEARGKAGETTGLTVRRICPGGGG